MSSFLLGILGGGGPGGVGPCVWPGFASGFSPMFLVVLVPLRGSP